MLATLNLQLSPIALSDETLPTSVLAPDGGASSDTGFADMLQLRFDAMPGDGASGGEILPLGGSQLPLQALQVGLTEESLSRPEISHGLMPLDEYLVEAEAPQIALQVPLQYPATSGVAVHSTLAADAAPIVAAAVRAPDLATGVASRLDQLQSPETRALPTVGLQTTTTPNRSVPVNEIPTATAANGEALRTAPGLRPGVLPGTALGAAAQPAAGVTAEADRSIVPVDLPRRTEMSPLAGMAASSEEISEVFKARPTVTQPVQVLNTQPNPQQSQLLFTTPPSALAAAETSYAAAAQQATDLIPTSVRDSAWGEQVGQRVLMMAGNQMKTAEIRLTPAELGPLRVQVSVDDGAANVTFQAQHAVTREAIEQALPRLRELLAENGLSLGQANVGEQGVAERNQDEGSDERLSNLGAEDALEASADEGTSQPRTVVQSNSLVDTFA